MGWYGDPEALHAAARRLTADAQAVRERATALVQSAAAPSWQGEAAEAFRAGLDADAAAMRRAADELDDAAAELRAHAVEVAERLARLDALADTVTDWIGDRVEMLR